MRTNKNDSERLQNIIDEALNPIIPKDSVVAIFDFPNHSNVGDSAIWLGEMTYLKKRCGKHNIFIYGSNFDRGSLPELKSDTLVLINGGGNLGDVWPKHQSLREDLIRNYVHNRVIQMPQSIHFENSRNASSFGRVIDTHPDLYILCRDAVSMRLCSKMSEGSRCILCPDMALYADNICKVKRPKYSVVAVLRKDRERKTRPDDLVDWRSVEPAKDWLTEPFSAVSFVLKVVNRLNGIIPIKSRIYQKIMFRLCARAAKKRVDRGVELLCSGKLIVTDRLHVHLICCMLCIPHIIIDNSYGKIGRFCKTWNMDDAEFCMVDDLEMAKRAVVQMQDNVTTVRGGSIR